MRFAHQGIEYELPDAWWLEAGMPGFSPSRPAYVATNSPWPNLQVLQVAISAVEPLQRNGTHGVFNDNPKFGSAHDRVVRILRGFRENSSIPPVEIARLPGTEAPRYKLIHGGHRMYCSIAAGYSHVPAVEDPDFFDAYPSETGNR